MLMLSELIDELNFFLSMYDFFYKQWVYQELHPSPATVSDLPLEWPEDKETWYTSLKLIFQ